MFPIRFLFFALAAALVSASPESAKCARVYPTAIPSPYPTSPHANEFSYRGYNESTNGDINERQAIHDAFADLPPMLAAAIASLRDLNDDTYNRYFPMFLGEANSSLYDTPLYGRSYVEGVFGMLIDADSEPLALKPLTAKFKNEQDVGCCCGNGAAACFLLGANSFNVCPALFEETARASAVNCTELGDQTSWHMDSITSTLLHEFMLSDEVGGKAPSSAGRIIDVAYHPDNCARLAAGPEGQKAFINADSYSDFASSVVAHLIFQRVRMRTLPFADGVGVDKRRAGTFLQRHSASKKRLSSRQREVRSIAVLSSDVHACRWLRKSDLPEVPKAVFGCPEVELLASPECNATFSDNALAGV